MKNQNKSLVVLKLVLRSLGVQSLNKRSRSFLSFPLSALFISILLLLSVVAIPGRMGISAQQPAVTQQQETRATAERLLQEALQLYKQGTVESKRLALAKLEEALKLFRVLNDLVEQALTLVDIADLYSKLGEKQIAISYYNQSLPLMRAVGKKAKEARILTKIADRYSDLGEKKTAISYYNQSLPLSRQVRDIAGVAITLNNIGTVYSDLGEKKIAFSYFNQSLPLRREVRDKEGEAATLTNIGKYYADIGEKQTSLSYFNQALPLMREVGDKEGEGGTLSNIGFVYSSLGEKQTALSYYNQSLPLIRAANDKVGEGRTLQNIGKVYSDLREHQKALSYFNQALPLFHEVGYKAGVAYTLNNIGSVYLKLGEKQQALSYFNKSLLLMREVGNKAGVAIMLSNIGSVYDNLGQKQLALSYYNQSLRLTQEVDDKAEEPTTLTNIALLERNRGNLNAALNPIKDAINIIESLRTKVVNQELRISYFASVQVYYQFYIDLLMQLHKQQPSKGYDALALHTSERARARNLLELLTEANVDIRQGVDSKLVELERSLLQQLNAAEFQKTKLLQGQYTNKQLDKIKQLIESLEPQLDDIQAQIRLKSPEYATLTQGNKFDKLVLTLPQIQQLVLDDNTLLLEYSLGEERSFLWAVSKTGITSYELPKGADIEAAAQAFKKELLDKKDSAAIPETGIKLSQMILAPVASQLRQKRLLIIGDGALQTIPFTVLPIPQGSQSSAVKSKANSPTPLLIQHEIVTLPSASSIGVLRNKFIRRKPAPKTIAVLADPVFSTDDERLKNIPHPPRNQSRGSESDNQKDECVNLNRLNYTKKEAEDILSLEPNPTKRFSALDFAASVTTAVKPDLSQYQIVHFATHGCVSEKNPQLSKLVLSQFGEKGENIDGNLNLNKIYNLNLPVELVTLSACKTGLGKNVQGEGLIGLTRGFMYAGAKRVVVSLWSVNDLTTASLMQKFYQKMLLQGQNPVAALRAAQLEMWNSGIGKAPYYWAAFTIQGEWQ